MERPACSQAKELVFPEAHDFPKYLVAWTDLQSSYLSSSSKEQSGGRGQQDTQTELAAFLAWDLEQHCLLPWTFSLDL